MAVEKISDLLPISDDNTKANAYEVLGLRVGEANQETIGRAIESTIARVKTAKSQTDPVLWKKIAGIVQTARLTLSDSKRKSRLDSRIQAAALPTSDPTNAKTININPTDPLAALLPPVNPMQPIVRQESNPVNETSGSASQPKPPKVETIPHLTAPQSFTLEPLVGNVSKRSARRPKRRRKSIFVPMSMSLITLGLIAVVGLLTYAIFFRQDKIAISRSDGGVSIISSTEPPTPTQTKQKAKRKTKRPLDHVAVQPSIVQVDSNAPAPMALAPRMSIESPSESPTDAVNPSVNPGQKMLLEKQTSNATDIQISQLRSAISRGDWLEIKKHADAIQLMDLSNQQRTKATGLLSVADLASYYRTGIERAVAELNAGDDFEVKDGFRVLVVGKTDRSLTIRYDAKTPKYTFDSLPLSLAHRLATFQIPTGPTGEAAKAVYQAVAPKSTPGHRSQAIGWLRQIEQPIDGADVDTLSKTLQSIFDKN